jgi:hypothetical protein
MNIQTTIEMAKVKGKIVRRASKILAVSLIVLNYPSYTQSYAGKLRTTGQQGGLEIPFICPSECATLTFRRAGIKGILLRN